MKKLTIVLKKIKNKPWSRIINEQKNALKQALKEMLPCCLK